MDFLAALSYGDRLRPLVNQIEDLIKPQLEKIRSIVEWNQWKVLSAFRQHQVGDHHFAPSTGYGYDDVGREKLEEVYATIFGTEAAIVRPQLISGTHAIATCLFGLLRPGDELIYITGKPYDTLEQVIGQAADGETVPGSLADFGILYKEVRLTSEGAVDFDAVRTSITPQTKVIGIQRSRGYDDRPSFQVDEISQMIRLVKSVKPDVIVFIDNCYGEFVETREPTQVGADIMAGSLIKNPGGGLVRSGGYIVGHKVLIEQVGTRLFAPGIGLEGGANLNTLLEMYQGLFLAPHVVGEALKGAVFSSALLTEFGFQTDPVWNASRTDLIQSIRFESKEVLITFCQGLQKASPINAHVVPHPSPIPGYEDEVIMAGGTFIQGSSIELSADGPLRSPYLGYVQGGLTYEHVKIGVLTALNELLEQGLLSIN